MSTEHWRAHQWMAGAEGHPAAPGPAPGEPVRKTPSFIALNRILEDQYRADPAARERLGRSGIPLLADARALSDEELAGKLGESGARLDPNEFSAAAAPFVSAQEMAKAAWGQEGYRVPESRLDWTWPCLAVLWERRLRSRPSLEMIDDLMQAGYAIDGKDPASRCRAWLEAWKGVLGVVEARGIRGMAAFDLLFGGTQSLYNWVQDLEMELGNAGLEDPSFHGERIRFVEEFLRHFGGEDPPVTRNMRVAMAESLHATGRGTEADAIFGELVRADPKEGWNWINWSDVHRPCEFRDERGDPQRAERILLDGLAVDGLREREVALERLGDLYRDLGREAEAEDVDRQLAELKDLQSQLERAARLAAAAAPRGAIFAPGPDGLLADFDEVQQAVEPRVGERKVSPNERCPCGSGKKFKKCCGRF